MFCKFCGEEISPESAVCPKCGKEVNVLKPTDDQIKMMVTHDGDLPAPPKHEKKKGFVGPIATLLVSVAGWIYMIATNSINGIIAWFKSSSDLNSSVSNKYEYFGNNFGGDELLGNIGVIAIMIVLAILGVVGVVWLIKRLVGAFLPKKEKK